MHHTTWAEVARSALAGATVAALELRDCRSSTTSTTLVPLSGGDDGRPLVTLDRESPAVARLAFCRVGSLTVAAPGVGPGAWTLRLVGTFQMQRPDESGLRDYSPTLLSVRLRGPREVSVPVADFLRSGPDPLASVATGTLRHLEAAHQDLLVACARTRGVRATAVVAHRLDRHGLELVALADDGAHRLHLPFPGGPVTHLDEVPHDFPVPLACATPLACTG